MPHLLLVDDDDLFRESLSLNLIDEGYEVTSFDNGRDALAYLSSDSADVMLLDWRMPNLTGIDVLRQMRGADITIPVIFLTVLSDDIYEETALEGGAVDFLDKSRRLPILLKRLQLIAEGGREPERMQVSSLHRGALMLRFDTKRALWAGRPVNLTLTEFRIVTLLAERQIRTSATARSTISSTAAILLWGAARKGIVPMYVHSSSVFGRSCARSTPISTTSKTTPASDTAGLRRSDVPAGAGARRWSQRD